MTHLPECDAIWHADLGLRRPDDAASCRVCGVFRACEQRVAAETISRLDRWQQHSPLGRKTYEEGVQAARDAVAALPKPTRYENLVNRNRVLAAIDALKGEQA